MVVDARGWRAFRPLTTDFIIAPDGSFVGEQCRHKRHEIAMNRTRRAIVTDRT